MSFPKDCKLFPTEFIKGCIDKFIEKRGQPTTLVLNSDDCIEYLLSGFLPKEFFMGLKVVRSDEVPSGSIDIQIRKAS